jgi:hypothetical protein
MNGHGLGERAGWLLAATLVAVGATSGLADRHASGPVGPPIAETGSVLTDSVLADSNVSALAVGSHASAALAADLAWPFRPPIATPKAAPPKPAIHLAAPKPPAPKPTLAVWWAKYQGVNHVWMPTIGINRTVYSFPCSRSEAPDNLVYRWGCAGANNVYLLGHAYGVFKALHDAYYNGKLKVGMPVVYADSHGRERLYRVKTWRIVSPIDAAWAIASQPVPSMTLQTCIGADGSLRLNIRLVEANS